MQKEKREDDIRNIDIFYTKGIKECSNDPKDYTNLIDTIIYLLIKIII